MPERKAKNPSVDFAWLNDMWEQLGFAHYVTSEKGKFNKVFNVYFGDIIGNPEEHTYEHESGDSLTYSGVKFDPYARPFEQVIGRNWRKSFILSRDDRQGRMHHRVYLDMDAVKQF